MLHRDIGVAIGIPEPYTSELQVWRERLGDPNAADIPPHVTLLPPTALHSEELEEVEEHLRAVAAVREPFIVHLRGTGTFRPVSPVVFVPLVQGISDCEQLERVVRSGPLSPGGDLPVPPARHRRPRCAGTIAGQGFRGAGVVRRELQGVGFLAVREGSRRGVAPATRLPLREHAARAGACAFPRGVVRARDRSPGCPCAGPQPASGPPRPGRRRYQADTGDRLAAAVTFYWFLSLFPILLLAIYLLRVVKGDAAAGEVSRGLSGYLPMELVKTISTTIGNKAGN